MSDIILLTREKVVRLSLVSIGHRTTWTTIYEKVTMLRRAYLIGLATVVAVTVSARCVGAYVRVTGGLLRLGHIVEFTYDA